MAHSLLNAQTIDVSEYFFDTDPGAGNGFPLAISTPGDMVTFSSTISISGLVPGHHYLYIRTRTSDGKWSLYEPREFYIQEPVGKAEYFFDTDPGVGSATPIPITTVDDFTFTTSLPLGGVSPGRHYLYIRTQTSEGRWSLYEPREFFIQEPVAKAEYFFDTDPGVGSATPIPITSVDDFTFTSSLPIGSLSTGHHYLYVRTRTSEGRWSLHEPREFFVQAPIPKAEYFFDTDPGIGSATPVPITTVDDFTFTTSLPVGGLPDGDHYLYVRTKDETGAWSLYEPTLFTVSSVVPIGLTTFSAKRNGATVDLSWVTASETNNDYFAVERWVQDGSYTEDSFVTIDIVKGNGTTSTSHRYYYSDTPPDRSQTIYYRLRQVDLDGKSTYSQVVAVLFDPLGTIIKVYPNPGSMWFTLEVEGKGASSVGVEMFDASGRQIESHETVSGSLVFGRDWSSGVYLIKIMKQEEVLVVKVVKGQ